MDFKFMQCLKNRQFPIDFPGHWVAGVWQKESRSEQTKISMNPSRDEEIIRASLDRGLIAESLEHAFQSRQAVESIPLEVKIETIQKFARVLADYGESVVDAMCIEVGKPRWDSIQDLNSALDFLNQASTHISSVENLIITQRAGDDLKWDYQLCPVGVTISFLPFSAPLTTFVQSFTCCLLAGCPLVVMTSGHATLSGILYANLIEDVQVPTGVVSFLFGNFALFRTCLADNRVKAVLYTGSREHCDMIRRESSGFSDRQLLLQSGGKNAVIIDASADLTLALKCTLFGVLKSAGQLNTSTSRVFVHQSFLEQFASSLKKTLANMVIGPTDMADSTPQMGPLYSKKSVEKFLRFQTMANRSADETIIWGKARDDVGRGYFVNPGAHIINKFDPNSAYQSNVMMIPDLAIYPIETTDEAIEYANRTNAAYILSYIGDSEILKQKRNDINAPNVLVNLPTVGAGNYVPVVGKILCGHHRLGGLGYIYHLTYPQAFLENKKSEKEFEKNYSYLDLAK